MGYVYTVSKNNNTYGVTVYKCEKLIRCIPDIFTDETEANEFVLNCNKGKLSVIHLDYVIQDTLGI